MRVRPTYPIEEPYYPLHRKLCGPQRGSVLCGEEKNILSGNRTQYHPANSLVTKPTELFWPPCALTYVTVTGDTEKDVASETAQSLAREANGSPEPG